MVHNQGLLELPRGQGSPQDEGLRGEQRNQGRGASLRREIPGGSDWAGIGGGGDP